MALTNTFVGFESGSDAAQDATAENSTAIGSFSYTTASNQVALGNDDVTEIRAFGTSMLKAKPADHNFFFGPAGNMALSGGGNIGVGDGAMVALTTGGNNTAFGNDALGSLTSSSGNVAIGDQAMALSVTSTDCTAIGAEAMRENVSGVGCTAVGRSALAANPGGEAHTAIGAYALEANITGSQNVAIGNQAARGNISGSLNVVMGADASLLREAGDENVIVGAEAMADSSDPANCNVAVGHGALRAFGGDDAVAIGHEALGQATGTANTALGAAAGGAVTTGASNVFLGKDAGTGSQLATASNSIAIGAGAYTEASNQVVLGNSNITHTVLRGKVGIGIGMATPGGNLHVASDGASANLPMIELAGQTTDAMHWAARIIASKTSAPGDEFGPSIVLQHRQTGVTGGTLGIIGAVRIGGNDSTGEIRLRPNEANTLLDGLAIRGSSAKLAWNTSIPAGGANTTGYKFSNVANFGIFFGSGAPTMSAAKGSLYLRSDGSTTDDRAYINTDGATTWTALLTAI